jgi:hypothetical protein
MGLLDAGSVPRHGLIAEIELEWDDDDNDWCAQEFDGEALICGEDTEAFLDDSWRTDEYDDPREINLCIFNGDGYRGGDADGMIQLAFMLHDDERIMICHDDEWRSLPIHSVLKGWLARKGCTLGVTYTAVFRHTKEVLPYTSVTKRRRITLDVEVTVKLDQHGRPLFSPGRELFEAGAKLIERMKCHPCVQRVQPKYWNVDHVQIDSPSLTPTLVDEGDEGGDYMKFHDKPGVWNTDRLNIERA